MKENQFGSFLRECRGKLSLQKLANMIGCSKPYLWDIEKTLKAFSDTLKKLKTDYLDLYLIHHAYGDCYGSWRAMEKLYKEGYIRAIGVSNFEPYRLVDLVMNHEIVPAIDQTETHPYCQQKKLKETLKEWDIKLTASEGLAQGMRGLFTDPTFTKIGEKYGKTAAQVVLRWR